MRQGRRLPRGIPAASLKRQPCWCKPTHHDCLPRGIPAASLKAGPVAGAGYGGGWSSAGNTRGLIEARKRSRFPFRTRPTSSAGNTRGLIEAWMVPQVGVEPTRSSAGNTRGLIEARRPQKHSIVFVCLPRGIPAASLKRGDPHERLHHRRRLPRGIPAASLKRLPRGSRGRLPGGLPRGIPAASLKRQPGERLQVAVRRSSAGNTRGLIEARPPARYG